MKTLLENKIALVTGASSGIGRATALAFAQEGAKVVLADVSESGGKETLSRILDMKQEAIFVKCDVSNEENVKNLIQTAISKFGRIDCAFNNAGIEGAQGATQDCTNENWDRVMNINLKGVWLCMKYEIQQMLKQGGGSIVNCASIAGLVGFQGVPAYTASKHGIIGLTRTAALELAKSNIRVNAVCPGVIHTAMIDRFTQGNTAAMNQLAASEPMGRMGKPEEIADSVLWLCSGRSSFVTGQSIAVDGGWIAQ